jgi:transcriptional regulator with XRE-family HTH domain
MKRGSIKVQSGTGKWLKDLRRSRGVTLESIADKTCISIHTLRFAEGRSKDVPWGLVVRYLGAMGISVVMREVSGGRSSYVDL